MESIASLGKKTIRALKKEGPCGVARKAVEYVRVARARRRENKYIDKRFKDVLFINGCNYAFLPHPPRYRVQHQMEQLHANGIECDECFYMDVDPDRIRNYRVFIFFRCPYTERLGEFIRLAKEMNKRVIYDIDDLVIDTKYTDTVKFLDTLPKAERELYDRGVREMQQTLRMCDAAITTTERLAEELSHYCPQVFINRNTASEEMLQLSEEAFAARQKAATDSPRVKLGYFSGSITHNDDFVLIKPVIAQIMEKYDYVELHIVGLLDVPAELERFKERIIAHPFVDWKDLPGLIASVDVNLAPLENTIFNEAKSENKWVEAALVRVPTIAGNLGAFARMVESGKTGILCDTQEEWYAGLERLVTDETFRKAVGRAAYDFCKENCVTMYTGYHLASYIRSMQVPNLLMVLPMLNISGGILVALEHCKVLREQGVDVTIMDENIDGIKWYDYENLRFPVLCEQDSIITGRFDKAVATLWSTVNYIERYPNIGERYYLVQGFETNFFEPNDPFRIAANRKYSPMVDTQFVTISKWCQGWLRDKYGKEARYAPNGIRTENYHESERDFSGKIRILVEGDCGVYYKNVDESFQITNQLDPEKFEVWYLTYNAKPKEWYRIDRLLQKVPFKEVSEVYRQCHIVLKTSILESFSYPPLEMMATGGYAVVVPNDGNLEYLVDGENCLMYPQGETDKGLEAIRRICTDESLRRTLRENGKKTVCSRDWKNIREDIAALYE